MKEIVKLHSEGRYFEALSMLRGMPLAVQQFALTLDCLIKANKTDVIPYFIMDALFSLDKIERNLAQQLAAIIYGNNIVAAAARIHSDLKELESETVSLRDNAIFSNTYKMKSNTFSEVQAKLKNKDVIVFPMIWPIAYGDSVVLHQYIRHTAMSHKTKAIVFIAPLNRPELKALAELNDRLDFVLDVTLLDEEHDRATSLFLKNGSVLNVSVQEKLIRALISNIMIVAKNVEVIKLRYLPMLDGVPNIKDGLRIWEARADLFINHEIELAKLVDQPNINKNDIITVHFREATYGDTARNVSNAQAQDIINALKEAYPTYKIIRIGDPSMTQLDGCSNALDATLKEQIAYIQQSKLFIGCHSAPQMMAVACSDTPIICINYTAQETTQELGTNIASMSYEPIGKQVKKIHYTKMLNAEGDEIVPRQHNREAADFIPTPVEELMESVKGVLG